MKLVFRVVTVLYLSLIFYVSSLSAPVELPSFPGFDKLIHFMEFGLVGYLVYNSICDDFAERAEFISISFSIFYGGLDEIHQYFIPGRSCDWMDFLADSLGVIVVVLFCTESKTRKGRICYDKS